MPLLTIGKDRRAQLGRRRLNHLHGLILLGADDNGHTAFDDAGLFARNRGQGVAKELLMVDRNRRDDRHGGCVDHVGRVQTPAQPDLEQRVIRRRARKGQQTRDGRDLEIGDVFATVLNVTFVQNFGQVILGNQFTRQTDAFMKPCQMRRRIGVHGFPRTFQSRADHGLGRSLAVRARDMDHGRQVVLRIAKRTQQPPHPIQRQVNHLGVQPHHARQDYIRPLGHGISPWWVADQALSAGSSAGAGSAGAGSSPLIAGG